MLPEHTRVPLNHFSFNVREWGEEIIVHSLHIQVDSHPHFKHLKIQLSLKCLLCKRPLKWAITQLCSRMCTLAWPLHTLPVFKDIAQPPCLKILFFFLSGLLIQMFKVGWNWTEGNQSCLFVANTLKLFYKITVQLTMSSEKHCLKLSTATVKDWKRYLTDIQ